MHADAESPVALLSRLKEARAVVEACEPLSHADPAEISDELLREAASDIDVIHEICGEIYEMIAYQVAENELAEIKAEEQALQAGHVPAVDENDKNDHDQVRHS
jgi:hypothetical protein